MASVTIKVISRSAKKPIKNLPTSIQVTDKTSVQDVKDLLAKQARVQDPNRLGLFDPEHKKTLKDKKAFVTQHKEVMAVKEILVKDLGPQISWRTVFLIEYAGPIFIHLSFLLLGRYIYTNGDRELSSSQKVSMAMVVMHFLKREIETLYVHKFSANTMPIFNIFKNSAHYWALSGLNLAYWTYSPTSYAALESYNVDYINIAGLVLYIYGEFSNLLTHITLSRLRSSGGTERGIPQGYGFNLVTCPNYLFEVIAWIGVLLVSKSLSTLLFIVVATAQMYPWAVKKERALRADFPDKYKKKRYVMFPGPDAILKALRG